jgi:hypothetical protein
MPLDPSISLQVRPTQFEAFDPTKTLMTIAQLQQIQQQAALRDLQMQDLRLGLAEYPQMQRLMQAEANRRAGLVPGADAAQAVRPIGASGGMSQPGTTPATPAPEMQGGTSPQASTPRPVGPVSSLPPFEQSPLMQAQQAQYGTGLQPPPQGMPQPPPPGAPQAPGPAGRPAASQPGVSSFGVPSMEELTRRQQFYLQMGTLPKLGLPHAKEMMALDKEDLDNRVKAQEFQFKSVQKSLDLLSPIQDDASMEAARPILRMMNSPLAQLGPWSDPRTQQAVQYAQQAAISTKDRMEQQIARDKTAVDWFKAQTEEKKLPIEQQKATADSQRALADLLGKGEVDVRVAQVGDQQQLIVTPKNPAAAAALQNLLPYITPAGTLGTGPTGRPTPPPGGAPPAGALPGTVPPGMGPAGAVPPGATPQTPVPSAPPGTQVTPLGPTSEALEPGRAVDKKRLETGLEAANSARNVHATLNEAERLIEQGVYPQSPTLWGALETLKRSGGAPPGYDQPTLERTARLRQIGDALLTAQVNLGRGITDAEGQAYRQALGNFQAGQSIGQIRESIGSMRRTADQAITNYNTDRTTFERTQRMPSYPTAGTGGTGPPGQPSPPGQRPPAQGTGKTLSGADWDNVVASQMTKRFGANWRQRPDAELGPVLQEVETKMRASGWTRSK